MPGSDQEYDTEELDDLTLATRLLTGRHDWEDDLPTKRYLDADEEFIGRKAIVRLLLGRKPLDNSLRRHLAALFDPDPGPSSEPVERRLVFARRRGRTNQNLRKLQIAVAVVELRNQQPAMSRDDAINEITERFGFKSTRTVEVALEYLAAVRKSY